jgi:hypothetical protein
MFQRGSRYYNLPTRTLTLADGTEIVYLQRRFIPRSPSVTELARHTVQSGDRLDNVTARYLGDPEQFWRIVDVSKAMRPEELTERIGRVIVVPLPDGREDQSDDR